jgi:hypothetical protein
VAGLNKYATCALISVAAAGVIDSVVNTGTLPLQKISPYHAGNVAFLRTNEGMRVEVVHIPLFEPGYDRYFAH